MQKQNKKKRGIGALLAITSITACLVASTFAKYTTTGAAGGSARVAKFGIELTVEDKTTFNTTYAPNSPEATAAGIETFVRSEDETAVVAPGTGEKDAITFKIKGKSETVVSLKAAIEPIAGKDLYEEIFLKEGQYKDYTTSPYTGNFQVETGGYYPVVFTLTDKSNNSTLATGDLYEINTFLEETLNKTTFNPGEAIDKTFSLSWKWASKGTGENAAAINSADTLLGNLAADKTKYVKSKYPDTGSEFSNLEEGTDYSTNISFNLKLSVDQAFEGPI